VKFLRLDQHGIRRRGIPNPFGAEDQKLSGEKIGYQGNYR
jgi:hypothetical protein